MTIIEMTGVSKSYSSGADTVEVLSNINLKVKQGEFVAIVGYSGSGKTTLISTLAGLIEPDVCLLYTSPSPRDLSTSRMPSSA